MNKRGLFGALAALLALIGGALLFVYVSGADQRALASLDPGPVVVVSQEIPAGMRTAELGEYLEVRQIPRHVIVPGALTSIEELPENQVTVTTLSVGEQVISARFVSPDDNQIAASVPIPEGLQLVSIQLSPERITGAQLNAGDKVGIFASMTVEVEGGLSPFPVAAPTPAPTAAAEGEKEEHSLTAMIANDVLVARIQGAPAAQPTAEQTPGSETLPGSEVIVTLAVDAKLAAKIVFTKEFGSVWLSRQTPTTDFSKIDIVGAWMVFE